MPPLPLGGSATLAAAPAGTQWRSATVAAAPAGTTQWRRGPSLSRALVSPPPPPRHAGTASWHTGEGGGCPSSHAHTSRTDSSGTESTWRNRPGGTASPGRKHGVEARSGLPPSGLGLEGSAFWGHGHSSLAGSCTGATALNRSNRGRVLGTRAHACRSAAAAAATTPSGWGFFGQCSCSGCEGWGRHQGLLRSASGATGIGHQLGGGFGGGRPGQWERRAMPPPPSRDGSGRVDVAEAGETGGSGVGAERMNGVGVGTESNGMAVKVAEVGNGGVLAGSEGAEIEEVEAAVETGWGALLANPPRRFLVVGLCFVAFLLCNMDRVNMSIAILPMSAEYQWSPQVMGLVQSSFFWGYLLTQIAGGIWADRFGGKQVLGFGVIWWSLSTMATPIAAQLGLAPLLITRACMGIGEGVAMPAMNNLLSRWVPVKERSRSLALVYSGMYLGSVTGLAVSPGMIQSLGWPSVFYSFGALGALWFAVWNRNVESTPEEDTRLTEKERLMLSDKVGGVSVKEGERPKDIPWRLLLSKAPVWAIIVCHFCHNWGTFILLTWMPTYYNQVLGFNLTESGLFSVLPWLTMAVSANVGGWIADTMVSKGWSVTTVRKIMQTIGFLGPAICLSLLGQVAGNPVLAVACMMASQGADAFSQSGLYSNHQDIGPRYAGVLLGLSNTAGVLAGVFGTAATGYILQHGSWDDVFKVAVGLYIAGAIIWNVFSTGERIFD